MSSSMIVSNENILFIASDYNLYSIQKKDGNINWQNYTGWKSNTPPIIYKNTFFYGKYENEVVRYTEYNLNTGEKVRELPLESINSKPYFVNNTMYCTGLLDGGKLLAYNLEENKIIWQKDIGHGINFQPVYSKDKIIANVEDDKWFEIDYNGNFLKTKSKIHTYMDTLKIFVKNYKFLTHDHKEITDDFLKKNKLSRWEYQTKTSEQNTFILTEKQLLVLANNKKKTFQLDLETEFPTDNWESNGHRSVITMNPESVWFCYQNFLIHYDFKNNKRLRKVDLTLWNPHQLLLDNRTIWLISKNDGQLYGLDFEPDQKTADAIEAKAKMEFERWRCDTTDSKKIEAAEAAEEKIKKEKMKIE
ncbi:MAG TPA: hypothetical protein VIV55_03795 [Flavobacterium sp.]